MQLVASTADLTVIIKEIQGSKVRNIYGEVVSKKYLILMIASPKHKKRNCHARCRLFL